MDSKLVTDNLRVLQIELHDISSKWYNLGVQLRIKPGDLENIKKKESTPVDCQREMLMIWLKQVDPYPTRRALIDALKTRVIDEQQLANELQKGYTTVGITPSASPIQSVSGSHVSSATTPVPAVPQASTSHPSGVQLQRQPSRQQGSQQTGTKQGSIGGADQVSKATEISVIPAAVKRGRSESEAPRAKRPKEAADVEGGYTCEFVNPPPDDLLCQMCNYVAKEPQQVKCCGMLYCKSCLARISSNAVLHQGPMTGTHLRTFVVRLGSHRSQSCHPVHRVKCKNNSLDHFFDHKSNERIQKLKVKCTNSKQGCDWTGELKELDDHCSHQCPKEEIPCTFSEVGCETRVLRGNIGDHIAQKQQQHLHCAMTSILRLRQELVATQGKLQEVQKTLSKCMDEVRTLPKIFKVSNYAQLKTKSDTWYSTPFYSYRSECSLRLCIQPLQTMTYNEEVGVALELLASPVLPGPTLAMSVSLTVELLTQTRDATHQKIMVSTAYPGVCNVSHSGIQYLYDDCLFFRVSDIND